jgi:hypothetical protein
VYDNTFSAMNVPVDDFEECLHDHTGPRIPEVCGRHSAAVELLRLGKLAEGDDNAVHHLNHNKWIMWMHQDMHLLRAITMLSTT